MTIYFDAIIRTRKGNKVPFWETTTSDNAYDGKLAWFHIRYGLMKLYKLHQVDNKNFIAEDMHVSCRTTDKMWDKFLENPSLALKGF